MEYINKSLAGLGKTDRQRLAAVIRGTKGTISVSDASEILGVSSPVVAKMLARWAVNGWLSRVRRGLYIPVPLESRTAEVPLEDPWLIAGRVFDPCYIGGWSAAEYWDLTEQIFRTVLVMTVKKPRDRRPEFNGTKFLARTISRKVFFGLKPVWRGSEKISVSDPSRTILDMLNDPGLGGGIRSTADMFSNYLSYEEKNLDLLIAYADRLANGAVFKRLGFLLERTVPDEKNAINACSARLTKGNAKLDPRQNNQRLITRWRLLVPEGWIREQQID
ncbi:MAG: type IV toxin-antitoxin system AbiEi family antitoxin domain-containing protein [Thermoleophilia bacterium]